MSASKDKPTSSATNNPTPAGTCAVGDSTKSSEMGSSKSDSPKSSTSCDSFPFRVEGGAIACMGCIEASRKAEQFQKGWICLIHGTHFAPPKK